MKLTDNERMALQGIVDSDFIDGEHPVDKWVWSFSANPWDGDPKESRKFAGTLVSLIKKGLAKQDGEGRDACVAITQAGYDALQQ
jgi:hypothetical protein